jgi:ribonuclease HI
MNVIVHTDGGARGNPGPAAIGVVIESDGKLLSEFSEKIGVATNNTAEYSAVIKALEYLKEHSEIFTGKEKGSIKIQFFLDSTLVVNQLNGLFKIKEPKIREYVMSIRILEQELGYQINYDYVPREQNMRADLMVNRALDTI